MPLVMMCGIPCSGKSKRAQELAQYLETIRKEDLKGKVVVINDESLKIDRSLTYSNATEEKKARGMFITAVERHLNRDTIVILDYMNYIKGFRYQLYCVSRALGTPHTVVYCASSIENARKYNTKEDGTFTYPEIIFDELSSRFEEPIGSNRWDKPLFTVFPQDETPCKEIADAILLRDTVSPTMANLPKPITDTEYVRDFDRLTNDIINIILSHQKNGQMTGIKFPGSSLVMDLGRHVGLPELRRIRRQFTNINKQHTNYNVSKLNDSFIEYIISQL